MTASMPQEFLVEDRGYKSPCYVWKRAISSSGYGQVSVKRKMRGAHVVAYEKEHGPIPEGLVIDHLCRVPLCVNPDHLEAVTRAENTRRGRRAKLSQDDVIAIRAAHRDGVSDSELAERFGVTRSWIWRICAGRNANRKGPTNNAWAL